MNCLIFLVVRTNSTRLPGKTLLRIKGKPLIKILIDRISIIKNIKIVVCTTNDKSDDILTEYLQKNKIDVFRGSKVNVLRRLYCAAKKYSVKHFIVVEGDDIFCEPMFIEKTCKILDKKYEFVIWKQLPFGVSPLGINTHKLESFLQLTKIRNSNTGWGKLLYDSNLFKIKELKPHNKTLRREEIRLSIDYKEDLQLAKEIMKKLPKKFSLKEIIKIIDDDIKLQKINDKAKVKYIQNFNQKIRNMT